MTFLQLLRRSLRFYWQTNLAVLLGVVAATAVIGGALLVGDSVRDSLRQMTLDRLGDVDHALVGQRFFRQQLADDLEKQQGEEAFAPVLVMPGSLQIRDKGDTAKIRRAGRVNLYGVDDRFWKLARFESQGTPRVVLNERLARQLGIEVGAEVSVSIEIPAAIPRDALLGDREETSAELTLTVDTIAPEESTPGRFGLNPTQQLPLNAFVPLAVLQQQIGLGEVKPTRRNPVAKPARVNALFAGAPQGDLSPKQAGTLTKDVASKLTLADLGLTIRENEDRAYVSVESERMILEDSLAGAIRKLAPAAQTSPVLIYLLNEIHNAAAPDKYSMYSVVAGIDFAAAVPFGPFEYVAGGAPAKQDEVVLNEWIAEDLGAKVGDTIDVKYYVVGDRGELPEAAKTFRVAGIVRIAGAADDRGYSPDVPGVTDAETYGDWREPFPLKRDKITKRDDQYWEKYRTTPKIFLPLAAAQTLWQSRYGKLNTVRIAPTAGESLPDLRAHLQTDLLKSLTPEETGMEFLAIKDQGLQASEKSGDFTGLFIGFSFFLIVAAALLIGLLFRLGIERRTRELGLLSAIGWSPALVRRSVFAEGLVLIAAGVLLGSLAAVGYAGLMIHGLKTWWIGAVGTQFLFLSVHPGTLAIGAVIAAVVSALAVLWGLRTAGLFTTREQLAGASEANRSLRTARPGLSRKLAAGGLGTAALLLVLGVTRLLPQSEAFGGFSWQVVAFFVTGIAALVGSLSLFAAWLASDQSAAVRGKGLLALGRLGLRNASRHCSRSLLTASLLASAVFVVVAVATGQKNPAVEEPVKESGNGGFTLVAETSAPLLYDFNTPQGRAKLGLNLAQDPKVDALLSDVRVTPFRVKPGEDASCLNIYRTRVPTILGVPQGVLDEFTKEHRFRFADTRDPEPWKLLEQDRSGGVPVIGDMNTLMYSLHKGIGGMIRVPDDEHPEYSLEVVGMLDGSIFQGVLLMSEANFLKLFPDRAGFRYFLVECPPAKADEVSSLFESQLSDSGFDADRVADRLADFLAVQNTYLSTFQTLGGLGLLLGTFGLATVMLRNVLERRSELALMRAVGFEEGSVGTLVVVENVCLLLVGILCGGGSALLAMAPHLVSVSATIPWPSLGGLLGGVFVVGTLAAVLAVRAAVRTPIVATLRGE